MTATETKPEFLETVPHEEKISIVVPLYGYWNDVEMPELTKETLMALMARLKSSKHPVYYILVAENNRVSDEIKNYLASNFLGKNVIPIAAEEYASYSEYLKEGIDVALEETDSNFIMIVNPWVILSENAIDNMSERLNKTDAAIVSGSDLRKKEKIEGELASQLDTYASFVEERNMDANFWGVTRQFAQMITVDQNYKTMFFLWRDIYQEMYNQKGYNVISSDKIPFYSLLINYSKIFDASEFGEDKNYFISKWHFDPAIEMK